MVINKFLIHAPNELTIELKDGCNLVTGYTSDKKTLIYLFIKYMLGSSGNSINWDHAKELFGGDIYELMLEATHNGKQIYFKRLPNNSGYYYSEDGKEFVPKKTDEYKDLIESHFNFKRVELPNGKASTSFSFSEYMKMIFIDENNIFSLNKLIEYDGQNNVEKAKNFVKFLATGISPDIEALHAVKNWKKRESQIKGFEKATKVLASNPKKIDIKRYNAALEESVHLKTLNSKLEVDIKNLESNLKEKKIEMIRLTNYSVSINDLINEFNNASDIANVFDLEKLTTIDYLFYNEIKNDKENLKQAIQSIGNQIKEINLQIEALKEEKHTVCKKMSSCEKTISELKIVEDYNDKINVVEKFRKLNDDNKNTSEKLMDDFFEKTNQEFKKNIIIVCDEATKFLNDLHLKATVEFDFENFRFLFNSRELAIKAKGLRPFYKLSIISSLLKKSSELGIIKDKFLMCDTLWLGSDFQDVNKYDLKLLTCNLLKKYFNQIFIFENENNCEKMPDINYINLSK